jgi:predicted nucleic acid-binding protein
MTLVVDTSVVVKWYLNEPGRPATREYLLVDTPLAAPDILTVELANVLAKHVRAGTMTARQMTDALAHVDWAVPVQPSSRMLLGDACALSRRLEHPVYDCLFLALAASVDARLVTADLRLARLAEGEAVPVDLI